MYKSENKTAIYFIFQEKILSEKLVHEKEVERLQQEIVATQIANTITPVLNEEQSIVENKLKESNSSNHIQDDDEMVIIQK